ncbi:MAG: hypothetical protein HQL19_04695 [Candidatus Omnitrophica bacterium]|nr:hypothetical protein [Candidatus Omnitrophota bacterium]
MIYILPGIIACLEGILFLALLLPKNTLAQPLFVFLGWLIGLGLSGILTFTSFLFFGQFLAWYVITLNILVTAGFGVIAFQQKRFPTFDRSAWGAADITGLILVAFFCVPVVMHALIYPYGGWDAWSCWNLKARFLFLGGENWKNMFDPVLWRTNTAYPLLLPLMNAWSWSFGTEPVSYVPLANSCLITFLMGTILLYGIKTLTKNAGAILAPLWGLSILFLIKLASSQYSDLLTGTWLLAALIAFRLFTTRAQTPFLLITIICLGLMSFTKSEGLVLAVLTLFSGACFIALRPDLRGQALASWRSIIITAILAFLPMLIFQLFFAPDSHTFINGLTSINKPTSLERLQATCVFYGIEFLSPKWNAFWIISAIGILLAWKKAWKDGLWLIPAILGSYLMVVGAVYYVNTFFEIVWWLSTTLNRVLFALIPSVTLWVFLALL